VCSTHTHTHTHLLIASKKGGSLPPIPSVICSEWKTSFATERQRQQDLLCGNIHPSIVRRGHSTFERPFTDDCLWRLSLIPSPSLTYFRLAVDEKKKHGWNLPNPIGHHFLSAVIWPSRALLSNSSFFSFDFFNFFFFFLFSNPLGWCCCCCCCIPSLLSFLSIWFDFQCRALFLTISSISKIKKFWSFSHAQIKLPL
jgi:hypothetical protein